MDNTKNDLYYLEQLDKDVSFILAHTKNLGESDIKANELLVDSIMFRMIQISESVSHLSEFCRSQFAQIPWHDIRGMRNRIVHVYGKVDFHIIFRTIRIDLPILLSEIKRISALIESQNHIEA